VENRQYYDGWPQLSLDGQGRQNTRGGACLQAHVQRLRALSVDEYPISGINVPLSGQTASFTKVSDEMLGRVA
jgi:hypothetical protein